MEMLIPYIRSTYLLGNYLSGTISDTQGTLMNSYGDILLGRQTNLGNMLESAMQGSVEQDKGDQCWEVGVGEVEVYF